jgi:CelD/BcsL family acetyltransferase involved in cellulose biosynthesis
MRVIAEAAGLDELGSAWDDLARRRAGIPTTGYAWARACATTVAARERLHVVVGWTGSRVGAIAPLLRRRDRFERLELLGVDELREPMDLLADGPAALQRVAGALARERSPLLLRRVPAASSVVPALRRAYRGRGVVVCRADAGSPWIALDSGWARPESRFNAGRRSDLRRARRIAERAGQVCAEVLSPTPAELEPLLGELFRVEATSWKGRAGSALACDPSRQAFYRSYAAAASRAGSLRIARLRIGERTAAMQLAVEHAGSYWLLKIGYDDAFRACSPGTLLMLETVRHAATRGLGTVELLGAVEPWTTVWTRRARPCVSVRAYPAGGQGLLALLSDLAAIGRRRLRAMVHRGRPAA